MEINLITHNKNKLAEFKKYLEPEIQVNHIDLDYPEIRAETNELVAKHAVQELVKLLNKPIVVEDSGFYIDAFEGFPGVYTATVFKKIGNRGFLKLMQSVTDRTVRYKSVIAYAVPSDSNVHIFAGEEEGILSEEEKGNLGWGQDPIFIPKENNSEQKTYGEMRKLGENLFRSRAIERLKEYIIAKKA